MVDIPGYEGYYKIDEDGNVFSVDRIIVKKNGVVQPRKGKKISTHENEDGYLMLKLCKLGDTKTFRVHQLVAMAYIGEIPNGKEINHKDFNRKNNNFKNLEICTHQENISYSENRNRHADVSGSKNPRSRSVKIDKFNLRFDFLEDCAKWLIENGYTKAGIRSICHEVSECARGLKKSYLGLTFSS